ncbi:MAG: hypothetical protein LBD80_04390 [Tannerella sp.]|jgi:hypothetical protein|nr:hypothetical protein [Tannerella sp.]
MGKRAKRAERAKEGLLERMNVFFGKHEKMALYISLACGAMASILLFDMKVSLSGDDCDYVINAQRFIKDFTYPVGRGALYPMVISPFLTLGLPLLLLKALSGVFILASMWLMYKAFKGLIPSAVLMPALLAVNVCPYIFFYACYTYSEPFFMLMQSLFMYLFSKYFFRQDTGYEYSIRTDWPKYVFIGLCFLAMGLTRTVGYAVMGTVALYFIFTKQWKNLICTFSASVVVYVVYQVFKTLVWPESGAAYDITNYMAKNFYNPEQGLEDISGYIERLIVNSNIYISYFLFRFMGFFSPVDSSVTEMIPQLTVVMYILYAFCMVAVCLFKNKVLLYAGLYVGVMNFVNFVLLQTIWAQDRLIMIYYPYILLFLFGGLFYILKNKALHRFTWIYPVVLSVVFLGTCIHLKKKVGNNFPVLQQNISGNDLYGLTPDWENFIKMSRWANNNLPKDAVIASRKPSISYIYTGRNFFGIFNVPQETLDNVIQKYNSKNPDTVFYMLDMSKESMMKLSSFLQYQIMPRNEKRYTIEGKESGHIGIYAVDKLLVDEGLTGMLDSMNISYTSDFDGFIKQFRETDGINYTIINSDVLYNVLVDNNVKYLLLPKIRLYTMQNTGYYVNTVHQFVNFINIKYPRSFRMIHSIGKDEICELVEFIAK